MANKKLRITLIKSPYGTGRKHMATVRGLGLRRMHHSVELEDTAAVRGMINKVYYMVKCEQV
jgi:large subunit ribosomal protein L30